MKKTTEGQKIAEWFCEVADYDPGYQPLLAEAIDDALRAAMFRIQRGDDNWGECVGM